MKKFSINFGKGWYGEEKDDFSSFRWTSREASCWLRGELGSGKKYLRLEAGHSFLREESPLLEVFFNGKKIGERLIESAFSLYAFPFDEEGEGELCFRVNKVHRVFGDPRELGIMVRRIEVLTPPYEGVFLDGWYSERAKDFSFPLKDLVWMKKEALCVLPCLREERGKLILIEAGHPFKISQDPVLTVFVEGEEIGSREISQGMNQYFFPFKFSSEFVEVLLKLNRTFSASLTGDSRSLGVNIKDIRVISPDIETILYGSGWYEWEKDELFSFRWMKKKARVFIPSRKINNKRYISFYLKSEFNDLSQKLTLSRSQTKLAEITLLNRWNYYYLPLSISPEQERAHREEEGKGEEEFVELTFSVNKEFPEIYHPDDSRELGARISSLEFHDDEEDYEDFLWFHKNALLNYQEMKEGKTRLKSYPLNLGIDIYGKCNIKPPCVYCTWEVMKKEEGEFANAPFDEKTLEGYGPFFRSARQLTNCSIGEPLLHPRIAEILEFIGRKRKFLEISTNGQAFTTRTIKALAGKNIVLYVSLDAATKETYAKIRNDRWDSIIPNLILLSEERKRHNNLPKLYMVFMPMKVNKDDLEEYFKLCQKIEADALVLRPLFYIENPKIEVDRGGYHFDYKKEFLSEEEINEVFHRCDEFSEKYGIPVANQFNFGIIEKLERGVKKRISFELPRF